jgi:hypothetical protein
MEGTVFNIFKEILGITGVYILPFINFVFIILLKKDIKTLSERFRK